ncbi:hypothetical protein [Terriglobus roseus]|uniref:Uncharacterized protein n=1 Tax=Terriglobus roseus TaxID=392734 RepID=A0A1H4PLB8_9BACT|nr:hypothetical protein [Terriglobus roseus]SEC08110.1 hypothetical protein SAMN05443244_2598 [Terriglobus roseus]
MDFNLRALCAARALDASDALRLDQVVGHRFEFRSGITMAVDIASCSAACLIEDNLPNILKSLTGWARVYRYSDGECVTWHILALSEADDGTPVVNRIDLDQPLPASRRSPSAAASIAGLRQMTLEEASDWLIALSERWTSLRGQKAILQQPKLLRPAQPRIVVTGSPTVGGFPIAQHVYAMGRVLGADIKFLNASSFRDTRQRIFDETNLHGGIVIVTGNPHLNAGLMPSDLVEGRVYECNTTGTDLVSEIRTAIELLVEEFENTASDSVAEDEVLMRLMLRPMISHSKIGQYNHCSREEVLLTVKARRQNLRRADELLTQNAEKFLSTQESDKFFLWKAHNEGPEFFLNPKVIATIYDFLGMTLATAHAV